MSPLKDAEPRWTKGEWRVDPLNSCDIQTANGEQEIAATHPSVLSDGHASASDARANATLIAAAPDLYEALSVLLDRWNKSTLSSNAFVKMMRDEVIPLARSATEQARGASS